MDRDTAFHAIMGMRDAPSDHELALYARAQRYLRHARYIPGIRAIFVCNSLAMHATHMESDIDLFVVTAPRRLWLVRTLLTAMLQLLSVRVRAGETAGRFCLGFFVTTDALDLSAVRIEDDIYMDHWYRTLRPIVDIDRTYQALLWANAHWQTLSAQTVRENASYTLPDRAPTRYSSWRVWDIADRLCRAVLRPRTLRIVEQSADPWGVVVSEDMLKLHYEDKRRDIREQVNILMRDDTTPSALFSEGGSDR